MVVMAKQQTKYRVLGRFIDVSAKPRTVSWGGWTQDRIVAEVRLAEAEAYSVKREAQRGQHIEWKIVVRSVDIAKLEAADSDERTG